jgi:hypothetical protein
MFLCSQIFNKKTLSSLTQWIKPFSTPNIQKPKSLPLTCLSLPFISSYLTHSPELIMDQQINTSFIALDPSISFTSSSFKPLSQNSFFSPLLPSEIRYIDEYNPHTPKKIGYFDTVYSSPPQKLDMSLIRLSPLIQSKQPPISNVGSLHERENLINTQEIPHSACSSHTPSVPSMNEVSYPTPGAKMPQYSLEELVSESRFSPINPFLRSISIIEKLLSVSYYKDSKFGKYKKGKKGSDMWKLFSFTRLFQLWNFIEDSELFNVTEDDLKGINKIECVENEETENITGEDDEVVEVLEEIIIMGEDDDTQVLEGSNKTEFEKALVKTSEDKNVKNVSNKSRDTNVFSVRYLIINCLKILKKGSDLTQTDGIIDSNERKEMNGLYEDVFGLSSMEPMPYPSDEVFLKENLERKKTLNFVSDSCSKEVGGKTREQSTNKLSEKFIIFKLFSIFPLVFQKFIDIHTTACPFPDSSNIRSQPEDYKFFGSADEIALWSAFGFIISKINNNLPEKENGIFPSKSNIMRAESLESKSELSLKTSGIIFMLLRSLFLTLSESNILRIFFLSNVSLVLYTLCRCVYTNNLVINAVSAEILASFFASVEKRIKFQREPSLKHALFIYIYPNLFFFFFFLCIF